MNLYEIDSQIQQLLDMQWTQELPDDAIKDTLDSLLMDRHDKCVNIALATKNLKKDIDRFKEEEDRLNKKRKSMEKQLDWLKNYLMFALSGEKIDNDPRVQVYYGSSDELVIDGEVPEEYLVPQEAKIDKKAIKEAIKNGKEITGAHIEKKEHIVVR